MGKTLEEKRLIILGYCKSRRSDCSNCVIKDTCYNTDELNNSIGLVEDLYKQIKKDLKLNNKNKNPNINLKLKDAEFENNVIKFSPNYANDYKSEYEEIMCIECWDNKEEVFPNISLSLNIKQIRKLKNYLKEVLNYVEEN